jgi:integrase
MNAFDRLTNDTLAKIVEFGIKSNTVLKTFKHDCKLLGAYLAQTGNAFSLDTGLRWVSEHPPVSDSAYSVYVRTAARRRTVYLLSECREGRLTEWKTYPIVRAAAPATQEYEDTIDKYREQLCFEGKADATIAFSARVASDFLICTETAGVTTLGGIRPENVTAYFMQEKFRGRKPDGVKAYACRLKRFIVFLEEFDLVPNRSLHLAVPKSFAKQVSVVTTLSEAAANKLAIGDLFKTRTGLRDKAMILLALRLGLRKSDIINLKFGNINWHEDRIAFAQKKTGVAVSLPLLPDVGNAIAEYILEARPASDSEFVFLRAHAPYHALVDCSHLLERYLTGMSKSDCPRFGMHILRRTLATSMLRAGVARSVISAAIGQTDPNSVDVYLSADVERMRECALPLDGIECERGELN